MSVLDKNKNKINLTLILLFVFYILGSFIFSKNVIPIFCITQVFLINNTIKHSNKAIRLGEYLIIVASFIFFISDLFR